MDYTPKVESVLRRFCDEKIKEASRIDERYASLWQEIKQYLMNGGKRMRPRLVLLAYEAYEGKEAEKIIPIAAAWELLHACLLVHDDIIDRDLVRHNHPNLAGRYQSIYSTVTSADTTHYALSAALLGGDLLLMSAYELINSAPISSDDKLLVHSYINKALFSVAGGELIDTDSVLYPIEQSNPRSVAEYKTASYSLQLPLQCGAAMAGASQSELEKLGAIGLHAGIAFQIQDDLLGIFGDSNTTGKSNRSDIIQKKRTFLIQEALQNLDSEKTQALIDLFAPDHALSSQDIERIFELLLNSGIKEKTEHMIAIESRKAIEVINGLSINLSYKKAFEELVTKLTTRTS